MSAAENADPRPAPRPRLAAAMAGRRKAILDAAVALFHERGYLGTTVDDIAARAGVTKRTLYHHMGSKEKILGEIHSAFIDVGLSRWEAVLSESGSATETLARLIREHVMIVSEYRTAIAVFFEEAKHLQGAQREEILGQRRRYEHILLEVLARGVETGEFDPSLDVRVATLLILGGLTEIYTWYDPESKTSPEALVRLCTTLALDGVHAVKQAS
jgi:AcrR family transcriptional regulator